MTVIPVVETIQSVFWGAAAGGRFAAGVRVRWPRGLSGVAAFMAAVMRAANAGVCSSAETLSTSRIVL